MSLKKRLKRSIWAKPRIYYSFLSLLRSAGRMKLVPENFIPRESYDGSGLAGPDTEIVIEGFPRSGNSFAVAAMELAQDRKISIAHHFHVPAQIVYGCRRGIPVLVLIRNALDAVVSMKIRTPSCSMEEGLKDWIDFHKRILPYRDMFVAASFGRIVEDFGSLIGKINRQFGTDFKEFCHSEQNRDAVFRRIDDWNRRKNGCLDFAGIARPSVQREAMKERLLEKGRDYPQLLAEANRLLDQLISGGE